MESLSIFGMGFVGKAVYSAFSSTCQVKIYDKFLPGFNTLEEAVIPKFIFICVPTPTDMCNGDQDLSAIYNTVSDITKHSKDRKIIIIKSTVLPGTTRKLKEDFSDHDFVFNPEFLTQRNSVFDFFNQTRIVLGGEPYIVLHEVSNLYRIRFPHTAIHWCSYEEAELVKYLLNCYFASKVSFMNEVYHICEKMNISYNKVKDLFLGDQRVSNSHCDVPGPDGDFGFGGKCFPKDLHALIGWGTKQGFDMTMFKATEEVNERVRQDRDWEEIEGATVKKEK